LFTINGDPCIFKVDAIVKGAKATPVDAIKKPVLTFEAITVDTKILEVETIS
jgi:hypothetical protein